MIAKMLNMGMSGLAGGVIKSAYAAKNNPMLRRAAMGAAGGAIAGAVGATARQGFRFDSSGRNGAQTRSMMMRGALAGGVLGAAGAPLLSRMGRGAKGGVNWGKMGDLNRFAKASAGEMGI